MQKETRRNSAAGSTKPNPPRKLTRAEKKQIAEIIRQAKGDGKAHTAQQTIPYIQMYPDGICKVTERKYSKTVAFEDINYQLAQADDKTAIFENWCDFLNYFDASVSVQLSFINQGTQRGEAEKSIHIPAQDDAFNSIRSEYRDMLKNQLAKGNNGLVKAKYITFAIEADSLGAALYYGLNALSNNMILCDRKQLKNPNGLILGTPGSGKSFAAKREMTNAFLITDDDIIICDPEAEYFSLVQRLDGQVIRLSPTGKGIDGKPQYVNPMDINLNYSEDDSPLALKSDFILSLCELVIGGKEGLQPVDKTVIDRAVKNVYRPFLADPDPEKMPILGDLYDELLKQPEPEAARIAAALELYVSGSLNVFNHRTNVELSNRLVCFDIKQLGKQLKKLGMLIVQDQVWNRVTVNRAERKSTRYFMDEFHLLLKEEQTAAYSVEIWKRFRKWGGIPTAITQNVKDLLASREVENIFENSDFVLMLNQAAGDRAILAKQLNISPQQMKYVTHTEAGEGLIFYGNVVLPFVDRFPKDTELYRVMTTKPEEVGKA